MAEQFTASTFNTVYRDDFNPDNNYHRILFNSGRPLQARELTQLQTIIQEELGRLGRHIFKDGAAVNAGNMDIASYEYIKLDDTVPGYTLPGDYETSVIGRTFISSTNDIEFTVNDVILPNGSTILNTTLNVTYLNNGISTGSNVRVDADEILTIDPNDTEVSGINLKVASGIDIAGEGTIVSVQTGDFFVVNHFVAANQQSTYLSLYEKNASGEVGFRVIQDIVTVADGDEGLALFDNQGVTPNLASPGADRYRISLILDTKSNVENEELITGETINYIPVAIIRNGVIVSELAQGDNAIYNKLGDEIARRTYEESGDYIVDRFLLSFDQNELDDNIVDFNVSPGVAYVNGYRAATSFNNIIEVTKPRDFEVETNVIVPTSIGNYYNVDRLTALGIPNIDNFQRLALLDQDENIIGYTRVKAVEKHGDILRFYMMDFQMEPGESEYNVRQLAGLNIDSNGNILGVLQSTRFDVILENNNIAVRKNTNTNDLFYELPFNRVKSIIADANNIIEGQLTIQERLIAPTGDFTGNQVTLGVTGWVFNDIELWMAAEASSPSLSNNQLKIVLSEDNDPNNGTGIGQDRIIVELFYENNDPYIPTTDTEFLVYLTKTDPKIRTKTIKTRTNTDITLSSDGTYKLDRADIINIVSVTAYNFYDYTATIDDNTGNGSGAVFKITSNGTSYVAYVISGGTGYAINDEITILGSALGGVDGTNDLVIKVTGGSGGVIGENGITILSGIPAIVKSDITSQFELDNGQRDSYYGLGRVLPIDTNKYLNQITVQFKWFEHSADGDFCAVNSYPLTSINGNETIKYEEIPVYTKSSGAKIRLTDVLDFRSVMDTNENFIGSGTARVNELPRHNDFIVVDVEYYLGKNAKLVVNELGEFSVLEGQSSLNPKMPQTPPGVMELYLLEMAPYMVDLDDIAMTPVEARRYTMKDIGDLEDRLANLEETTALTLLELKTSTYTILDDNGDIRSKSGFFVDNFMDHTRTDLETREARSSIDPSRGILRNKFRSDAVRLKILNGNNTTKRGDNIYLNMVNEKESYINQSYVTGSENVNPFAVTTKRGILVLSPSKDRWMETRYLSDRIVKGDNKFNIDQDTLWDNWTWNWTGNYKVGDTLNTKTTRNTTTWNRSIRGPLLSTTTGFNGESFVTTQTFATTQTGVKRVDTAAAVVSGVSVIRETVGDRIVSKVLLPKMRSQKIFFKAEGLRPNAEVFAFFGGKDVSKWVRSESSFRLISNEDDDYSKGYEDATEHPDGPTSLITDASGTVTGSFFLPMTDALSFKTGVQELRICDVNDYANRKEATAWASTSYRSLGTSITRRRTVQSTRVFDIDTEITTTKTNLSRNDTITQQREEQIRRRDPLAQTFTVDEETGVFLTGVRLRFMKRPVNNNLPVYVQIRPTINGYPSATEIVPGTTVTKTSSEIAATVDPTGRTVTEFMFDEPAYLLGSGTEYSIVIISDSNHYEVAVAATGEFLIDEITGEPSKDKRLRRQPTMGSLFKSQNGRTWEPDQSKDLTFELLRAKFSTNPGTATLRNVNLPRERLSGIRLFTKLTDRNIELADDMVYIHDRGHGYLIGDKIYINANPDGTTQWTADKLGGISSDDIHGWKNITYIDPYGYAVQANTSATSFSQGTSDIRIFVSNQFQFNVGMLKTDILLPEGTVLNTRAKFISGKSLGDKNVLPAPYVSDNSWRSIEPNHNIYFYDYPRLCATVDNETENSITDGSINIQFEFQTTSDFISPVVDLQGANFGMVHNVIDNQIETDDGFDTVNGTSIYAQRSETHPWGGNAVAKHVTKVSSLPQTATGLKILLNAHRPSDAAFDVYYRTNVDADGNQKDIGYNNWTLINPELEQPADEDPNNFREYTFLPGGITGTLHPFDKFQVKIVMRSKNTSKVPMFKDLRVIALFD